MAQSKFNISQAPFPFIQQPPHRPRVGPGEEGELWSFPQADFHCCGSYLQLSHDTFHYQPYVTTTVNPFHIFCFIMYWLFITIFLIFMYF